MKLLRILGLAAVVGLSGCDLEDFDPDGGGGGGAGGTFARGFVFVRGESAGTRNVYAVDDAGDPNSPLQLTTQGGALNPTVSRNGRLVAFVFRSGSTSELRTVPTTGQGQPSTVFSSASTACSGCGNFRFPTFSPNGSIIAFTLDQGGYAKLARVNADGSGFQIINTGGFYHFGPSAFTADALGLIAARGTNASLLDTLTYVNLMTGRSDVISNLGSEGAQVVGSRVTVSPDGRKVAFDARTSSGSRIFVGTLDGQQQLYDVNQVTAGPAQDTYPSWRGNTELGFISNDGGRDNVYRISASSVRGSGNLVLVVPIAMEAAYGGT
ncbi:MAG TPA: hypothetical protein VEU33_12560 [Archangium sp.]|nr:hypothetical protein [Archangium sp.]